VDMGLPLHPTGDPRRDLWLGRAQPLSLVRPSWRLHPAEFGSFVAIV